MSQLHDLVDIDSYQQFHQLNTLQLCQPKEIKQNNDLRESEPELGVHGDISKEDPKLQVVYSSRVLR
jgi:hypothetical protein